MSKPALATCGVMRHDTVAMLTGHILNDVQNTRCSGISSAIRSTCCTEAGRGEENIDKRAALKCVEAN